MLRKLLKWLAALVAVLALAALVFVWVVLGVNPVEGDVDQLWELVSNDVDFFARWPGVKVLREPLAEALADEPGYEWLADARDELAEMARQVAREVNPQIPGGLVEVDFEQDFVNQEMALAGAIQGNYQELKPDNFIFLMRIPGYAKFLSALKRDFVRDKLPPEIRDRIEVVKGLYFRYTLDAQAAQLLQRVRSGKGRQQPNVVWFGRIKDVLLVSDTPDWIEAAIVGGQQTLPADTYFRTEFMRESERGSRRGGDLELFVRPTLASNVVVQHGREDLGGPLYPVAKLMPAQMTGDVTIRVTPRRDALAVRFSDNPPDEGFARVRKPHLVKLYEQEKGDLHLDLSEDGIGRFIPRRRTVAAFVLHADPETLVGIIMDFIPRAERENLDEQARLSMGDRRRKSYRDFRALLLDLTKDFGDTHMVVVSRPAAFEGADYATLEEKERDDGWELPYPQQSFTLISRVKDSALPDKVRETFSRNLRYLGLKRPGPVDGRPAPQVHKSGKFHLAEPIVAPGDWDLIHPAYGAMSGNLKYFVFSTNPEAAEAVYEAAANPDERLVNDPAVREAIGRLPREGTLALLLRGRGLRDALWDQVRLQANNYLDLPGQYRIWYEKYKRMGMPEDEIDRRLTDDAARLVADEYPVFRDRYEQQLAVLNAIDIAAFAATLGVGPTKQVHAAGYFHFAVPKPPTDAGE